MQSNFLLFREMTHKFSLSFMLFVSGKWGTNLVRFPSFSSFQGSDAQIQSSPWQIRYCSINIQPQRTRRLHCKSFLREGTFLPELGWTNRGRRISSKIPLIADDQWFMAKMSDISPMEEWAYCSLYSIALQPVGFPMILVISILIIILFPHERGDKT